MSLSFRLSAFSLSLWFRAFVEVCARFPAAMLCAAATTGAFIQLVAAEATELQDSLKLLMAALWGLPLCIGLAALAERAGWEGWRASAVQVLGLGLAMVCFFFLHPDQPNWEGVQVPRYFWALLVAHLWVALSPYLDRRSAVTDFWEYNKRLLTHFVVGAVYAAVIFLGLALAIAAVNALFDLHWSSRVYGYLFALVGGMFQTTFFLYHFPRYATFDDSEVGYPALLKNLCQYVFVPIVGLYFLILYAYSAKILLEWELPRGWVSSLVLGFSVAGIFTYLVNYRLPEYLSSRWVSKYQQFFWWVLAPMVVLLFVAIGRRISDYGVTPERYFVAHTGVWLLVVCAYFLGSKRRDIRFVPLSLAAFILPALLGPLNAFEVSQRSQIGILKRIFEKNDAFESTGQLKEDLSALPSEERERVQSILYFLSEQGALERLDEWLSVPIATLAPDSLPHFERSRRVLSHLRLERADMDNVLYLAVESRGKPPVSNNIAGFRAFYWLYLDAASPALPLSKGKAYTGLSASGNAIVVSLNGEQVADTLELDFQLPRWKAATSGNNAILPDSLSVVEWKRGSRSYRLFARELLFEERSLRVQQLQGMLFVK